MTKTIAERETTDMDNKSESEKHFPESENNDSAKSVRTMRQASKKQKPKGRRTVNAIDIILIAVIILIALSIVVRQGCIENLFTVHKDTSCVVEYTVKISELDEIFSENIVKDDKVYLRDSGEFVGVVTSVVSEPSRRLTAQGMLEEYPGHTDITVTISVDANYSDNGYVCGDDSDIRLAVGRKMSLRFPKLSADGYCTSIAAVLSDSTES